MFLECLSDALGKTQPKVYSLHRFMLAHYDSPKAAVESLLHNEDRSGEQIIYGREMS